jgi:NAD+ synthase (glutamine-hydrolysing)
LLVKYVDQDAGAAGLLAAGFAPDLINRVIGLVDRAEFKRRQYPPGPKVSMRAFGKDRRLPITSRWTEQN